jgi:peptide/nickel transport system ATP-binding protein
VTTSSQNSPVLEIKDLRVYYDTPEGQVKAVDMVSFSLRPGDRLAVVGESGCGKTTLAMALMRLHKPPARIVSGEVILRGRDILKIPESEMPKVRLDQIALVPQGAMNSLNPVIRVKDQIIDGIVDHEGKKKADKKAHMERVHTLLERVGLPKSVANMFPHELSGGMKQRVVMAIATALSPKVIIADEPTSALDVVVQRQVMVTLKNLQEQLEAAVLIVGHDMGLMAQFATHIGVMYAGKLVEIGKVEELFQEPLHPYTRLLISSLPTLDAKRGFSGIPGLPPALLDLPPGCVFHPRCPWVMERCRKDVPLLREVRPGRWVSCHLYDDAKGEAKEEAKV